MRKIVFLMASAIVVVAGFYSCKPKQQIAGHEKSASIATGDNARNSLDWAGSYTGVLPCADCAGIETRITLNADGSYVQSQKYLERDGLFETKGTFQWNAQGNIVDLTDSGGKTITHLAVAENKITWLDNESKVITGELANNYILAKINPLLVGKKWKLTELQGKPVTQNAFLTLDANDNRVSGNLGCNAFTGSYELKIGNRIKFSELAVTQKMCINMEVENNFKKVIELADNYNVGENSLVLNRARMAPLAKFVPAE